MMFRKDSKPRLRRILAIKIAAALPAFLSVCIALSPSQNLESNGGIPEVTNSGNELGK